MEMDKKLCFFITHKDNESVIELFEYDTVALLKIEIYKQFDIQPHKQVISGWKNYPKCDNIILRNCTDLGDNSVNCLQLEEANEFCQNIKKNNSSDEEMEVDATVSCFQKIINKYDISSSITFHMCTLNNAISGACLAPLEKRKILLLYLYKGDDKLLSTFMKNLNDSKVIDILKRNFYILGWDIEEQKYRYAFQSALKKCSDLASRSGAINCSVSTILCIVPIKDYVIIYSCLKGNISDTDFITSLENVENFFIVENQQEHYLEDLEKKTGNKNDMSSLRYQQLMADMLGDRDYDGFEYNQAEFLKKKIAYALLGQPQIEDGDHYNTNDMKQVENLYNIILTNNNLIAKYKDRVEISFIYNCTEPLPSEKINRAKKYPDYNPNTDLMPVPIFVLRKCHGSANPCRVFIDHMGRTYESWEEYKNRNKLHECAMVLPKNGSYEVDENGNVLIERHLSPACGIDTKILQAADYMSIAGGLISGGIFVAAAIPAITVAPAALLVGGITGVGVGAYSLVRSATTLYDRSRHRETLSFANSEARGAYINILAGALGFVGAGANVVVTQLATSGINIGTGARAVVNTISVVNVGASGVGVINSSYDVFDRWYNEKQSPSLLTVVQLTSSILFFGNAVYNFRSCSSMIEEAQVRTLENFQDSLRSNRHRKTFTKILKETIRQNNNENQGRAEVIAAVRNLQNKDEVFAVLTRTNKDMNSRGIKMYSSGGDIVLNGVKIDFNEFATMNKKQTSSFLSNIVHSEPTPSDIVSTRSIVSNAFKNFTIDTVDIEMVTKISLKLLNFSTGDIKTKIISALASLLSSVTFSMQNYLDELFPYHTKYIELLNMVVSFFARKAEELEEKYKNCTEEEKQKHPIFRYVNIEKCRRALQLFEKAVNFYCQGTCLTESGLKQLLQYFHNWLGKQIYEREEDADRAKKREVHSAKSPTTKNDCKICGGYYYEPVN